MKIIFELSAMELKSAIAHGVIDNLLDMADADEATKEEVKQKAKPKANRSKPEKKPDPKPEPEEEPDADDTAAEETTGDVEVSLEDARAALTEYAKANGKAKARKILEQFEVEKLTDLDASKYGELIEAIEG